MASAQRGLWKLMLKLPAMRGQLQMESAKNKALMGLCDAFDDATTALDELNRDPRSNAGLIREYETICSEIESEVIDLCINLKSRSI
ncbi:hypothetical protein [uncultured Phyllobacterium sp.]|uniref:hypothetical protein n=1 Tax=uncultured Phyllobacterium sp. TaxID=253813 RepID=UPI002586EA38|nr:hypothetical protein [uncultured Phyllobacterium sp.]